MHVLLITSAYKSEFNPVNALFFRDQALALSRNGHQVGVLCALPISLKEVIKEKKISFSLEKYSDLGVQTIIKPFFSIPKTPSRTKKKRFNIGCEIFEKYIQEFGLPDIIHVHTFLAGELALWAKENYKIPFVVTEHSTNFARGNFSVRQLRFAKHVFSESKANIAVSHEFARLLETQFRVPFRYIPNVVDTNFFTPSVLNKNTKNYIFLNIAHLDFKKNHKGLIDAFHQSFANQENYKLIIAGDGPERENLQRQIEYLQLEKQIELYGRVTRKQVHDLMNASTCFVLSSFHETFGVVLIEAMSCGLPVLATKSGGPETIIKSDDYGYLCEFNELSDYLKKIVLKSFNSKKIRSYVEDCFSETAISNQLEKIYFE